MCAEASSISQELLDLYVKRGLFALHEGKAGIWLDYPLEVDALEMKRDFLISLLKKVVSGYNGSLNPIKLNIYFESI